MATWIITVKDTTTYNGVHLEKGMFAPPLLFCTKIIFNITNMTPVRDSRVSYTIQMQREYASSPYH